MVPSDVEEPESLRELIARVIDNGKAYIRAEVALLKQTVATKTGQAIPAIGMIVFATLLVQAAITILTAALGLLLARWLGLVGGFAVAALIVLAVAGALSWVAARKLLGALR